MKPFSTLMYPDAVVFSHCVRVTGSNGASRRTFPTAGTSMAASVQVRRGTRTDGDGRSYTETVYAVYTPTDIAATTDDEFTWLGRTLAVEAGTVPKGIGDVTWLTTCLETK